nr:MAG TPA: hypothetical protein [Caudoviricetes sp.]
MLKSFADYIWRSFVFFKLRCRDGGVACDFFSAFAWIG